MTDDSVNLTTDSSKLLKDSFKLFTQHAVFEEFPVQKFVLDEKLATARQLAINHFLSVHTSLHVPSKEFEEALNIEELTIRETNKQALYNMVHAKLQTLRLNDSLPQHVSTQAYDMFENQYNEAKTWFCGTYPGFEIYWSEAVLFYVQNWVSQVGVDVHLAEATESYLSAIGAREVSSVLQAMDRQRSELLIQKHAQKRLAGLHQALIQSNFTLLKNVTMSKNTVVHEGHKELAKFVEESLE